MRIHTHADSQFDVSATVDIKLLNPYRKDLSKPLNRLGIPEKQFYRAADVAQLHGMLGCPHPMALPNWESTTYHAEPTLVADASSDCQDRLDSINWCLTTLGST
jgi:hypothetical protein